MSSVGALSVNITANALQFTKGLGLAQRATVGFASSISAAVAPFQSWIAAGLGMLTAGGIVAGLKSASEHADAMAKSADRLGLTTQVFTGLGHAANLAGVDMATLETSLRKMQINISDAGAGMAGPTEAFRRLGIPIEDLLALPADQQLGRIAQAIAALPTPADKAAAALDVFGKSGAGMINLLADGGEALTTAAAESDALGLAISRVDAAQLEIANDAMTTIGSTIGALAQHMAVQLAPTVAAVSQTFIDWAKTAGGAGEMIRNAMQFVGEAVDFILTPVDLVRTAIASWKGAIVIAAHAVVSSLEVLASAFDWFTENVLGMPTDNAAFWSSIRENLEDIISQTAETNEAFREVLSGPSTGGLITQRFEGIAEKARAAAEEIAGLSAEMGKINEGKVDEGLADQALAKLRKAEDERERLLSPFRRKENQLSGSDLLGSALEITASQRFGAFTGSVTNGEDISRKSLEKLQQIDQRIAEQNRLLERYSRRNSMAP